ncbi:MAG: undecaprenyl/decaprenyl-phosphate alpha-N-acetylglucosaminyl 1-phosphate transferase [Clostridia bacterium]|nr:undecaprenyl/decaprenyl-phosphate alpha-N-acetylglucosaminyl 1-phosphate transferase [Clostridia bacterium]
MFDYISLLYGIVAVICAALLAYAITPPVRVLAYKIGAIDIPADARRMHKKPIPRLGGLAIFFSFIITSLIFCKLSPALVSIWIGGLILCVLGTLDDIYRLHWLVKLIVQIAAAALAVVNGVSIDQINLGGGYLHLGVWSYPLTILWITGLTNAINFIDGLDGLACGVSAICACSICGVTLLMGDFSSALITAILAAACFGFLPFNRNPARIFMGDTGALFLGFTLAVISVEGVFKLHTLISLLIPVSIFALPLFDTLFAILRRVLHGKSPFSADRGHLHHRLVDMGFTQKETVGILYAICGILGMVALTFTEVMFKETRFIKSIGLAAAAIAILTVNFILMRNPSTRYLSGLFDPDDIPPEQLSPQKKQQMDADARGEEQTAAVEFTAEAPQEEQPAVSSGSDES